jgi:PKD repeat protein
MKPKSHSLLALMVLFAILALFAMQRVELAPLSAASYTGLAQISGPLQLDLVVSPPVGAPRDVLQLQVRLTNRSDALVSPEIVLQLPSNLQVDSEKLAAGATLNLTSNSVHWLAVVPGQNGTRELTLPLKVASVDLANPEQQVTVVIRYQGIEETASTLIWMGIPPRINEITNPVHVSIGQPLKLEVDADGPGPLSEIWELGDGRRLPINDPTVVYPTAGVYNVVVTVKNPVGSASQMQQITVVPHVAAGFRPDDDTPGIGEAISFVNESGGQSPVKYYWQFGDGNASNEVEPKHSYQQPGTYQVQLVIENEYGRSETSHLVTVGLPPTADILVDSSAPAGEQLTGQVVAAPSGTEFTWEMGDGEAYSGDKVSHAYRLTGDYYVTLTANNEFGSTKVGRWVRVDPGDRNVYLPMVSHYGGLSAGSSADAGEVSASEVAVTTVDVDGTFIMEPIEIRPGTPPAAQLLLYVNEARRLFDLPALNESSQLSSAAQKHTEDMAITQHTQHVGSDGSAPAERQLWYGYSQGYAGEATAWGFADPRQAVEFWVNSPGHRPIVLNRYATEVGVGYTADFGAPSIWYWTTEFGNSFVPAEPPALRVLTPGESLEVLNSELITFTWNWSQQLSVADKFTVYLQGDGSPIAVGSVQNPVLGTRYVLALRAVDVSGANLIGTYAWQIKLENSRGVVLAESAYREIVISPDPTLPTPTPVPTLTPTPAPTLLPTVTPTPTAVPSTPRPGPTERPLPPLVTSTPVSQP